jgi:hypothetical protein
MTGAEPPKQVKLLGPDVAEVYIFIAGPSEVLLARHKFRVLEGEPCTIAAMLVEPPYGAEELDFMKLPSPRALKMLSSQYAEMDLPNGTWCTAKAELRAGLVQTVKETTRCHRRFSIAGNDLFRRLIALAYIRAKFCAGQPEPPPPPRKPY